MRRFAQNPVDLTEEAGLPNRALPRGRFQEGAHFSQATGQREEWIAARTWCLGGAESKERVLVE